ncbi:MAG TPA: hypothetical protein VKB88_27475 [Bryobacteraceae bacterium]|nr:hypothetical protein [Bryobacteraceae bacterium]
MPRHESVTDEFVADLNRGFLAEAEQVQAAPDWDETQRRMIGGTYPYLAAKKRVDEGWPMEEIKREIRRFLNQRVTVAHAASENEVCAPQ